MTRSIVMLIACATTATVAIGTEARGNDVTHGHRHHNGGYVGHHYQTNGWSDYSQHQTNRWSARPHHQTNDWFDGHVHMSHPTWHDTTHVDFHEGYYQLHGNHYDYVPGHAHVHHTGHWDY